MDKIEMTPSEALHALEMTVQEPGRVYTHAAKTAAQRMVLALEVLSYIRQGKTLRSIAEIMGVSHTTVAKYRDLALSTITYPLVDDARKMMLEQIDAIIEGSYTAAVQGDDKAAGVVYRYMEQKCKLLGLYAPVQIEASHTVETESERQLRELLDQAERDNAAKEILIKSEQTREA